MKRSSRIIVIVLTALTITTIGGILVNLHDAKDRMGSLQNAEITVFQNEQELCRLNMNDIEKLPTHSFTALLKSSVMDSPEEHTYTGVSLVDLFHAAGITFEGRSKVLIRSADGYTVTFKTEEIQAKDNVYLVYKDNGNFLGTMGERTSQGPYMVVAKEDRFSQRWAKYVCELHIQ